MLLSVLRKSRLVMAAAVLALAVCAVALCAPTAAQAADQPAAKEPYTYTVRIFAGNQGTIDGEPLYVQTGLNAGDRFTFYQQNVDVANDNRYYVRGLREAGRDNATSTVAPSFEVTRDIDYVVAYGIRGQDVAYTVRYVDTDGNTLAPDETFYGNVGDSPVIAYRYFEGYQPQAYNLTGELYEDVSRNVYTFVYESTAGTGAGEGAGTGTGTGAGAGAGAGDGTATVIPAGQLIADDGTPLAGTDDVVDIRDDENPLAAALDNLLESSQILQNAWVRIITPIALAAIVIAIVILAVRRRKKDATYDSLS